MPTRNDDSQFEAELKRFRPKAASPLPGLQARPGVRWGMLAMAAAMTVVFAGVLWFAHSRVRQNARDAEVSQPQPYGVTLGRAEAALAQGGSFDETIDQLERAAKPQPEPKSEGHTQSAFALLGREDQ